MKIARLLPFIFLMLIYAPIVGQDVASLQAALNSAQGTERVDILQQLVETLKTQDPTQARKYAEEALDLSNKLQYKKGIIKSNFYLGIHARDNHNYRKAIRLVNEGLKMARDNKEFEVALQGLEILKTIYQVTNKTQKLAETERMIKQVSGRLKLNQTTEELAELERLMEFKDEVLSLSEEERLQLTAEKDSVMSELAQTTEEKLLREAQLARVAQERAELEKEAMRLEKDALETAFRLEKEKNLRNLAFALIGVLLFVFLAGWQRYRYKRQQKLAEIERQRVQRLEEIDRLKDQFLANTSHELRTPLNGIIGIAEWLYGKEKVEPEILKDNLSVLISAGKRLNNLVNDIMDFSRLRNAELQLHCKPLDVYAIAAVVLRINQPLAKVKNLELINHIPKEFPAVFADEDRLQQIFYNLVGNAIKFTNEGSVSLSATHDKDKMTIAVKDTGIGIPPEKHQSIFKAFHQEDGSMVREFAGTGLGLSITQYLVDLHGGKIWVESAPGEGSTFFFTIPLSSEAAESVPLEKEPLASMVQTLPLNGDKKRKESVIPAASDHKVKILIVDDEPVNQHVLSNHLDAGFYSITTAMNGAEALKAIEENGHFDLVILDVMMPQMSGYEVCEKIRERYLPSELPVIMVTAKNLVKDLVDGLNTGANDYLAKPFSRDEFLARVKTQLNLHKINQATGRFVPSAFLRTLGRENITEVQLGDQVEQMVTVFFSDIRGYTTLAESMTPEQNFKFVNAFYRRVGPLIGLHHGFINQYLGDAVMAIFQRNPMDALHTAIGFQKTLQSYNAERVKKKRLPIQSGVGFHTGHLIMGIIGDEKRMDAATISDTVNTAARIESLNKYYGTNILFSEDSLNAMDGKEAFNFRFLGEVQMKGKKLPVGLYECIEGDLPEQMQLKLKTLDIFNEGRSYYFNKQFDKASKAFQAVLEVNVNDETTKMFLAKTLEFLAKGVPEDWTGVEKMVVK